ncbi:coenzyme Q-binding protein COQ10 B, mitochondrial [Aspergillus viridinutans]|uniref:Coenzyme Q-binding protein COQ10 B, mitochondrial n=1 Tax=Aspergillus viridinutans TaxID=75553 RepID=A0A9P3CAX0_ASPVI|nr:coenzyme Q-binding protein COQ10 B, mitochondrial [Aspergillus viridinutans]GIK06894.1 coenzyme Q-binding protein COQ10 B, mitochondrial [Aspergillus viridinutans]
MKPSLPLRRICRGTNITILRAPTSPALVPRISHQQRTPTPNPRSTPLTTTTRRSFNLSSLSSLFPPGNGNSNDNNKSRVLTAARTLPYPPSALFKVISSVESYSQFLPFLTASTVTHRDPETGYPTRAFLTVGYGPLSETFTSRVDCNRDNWTVDARSGAKFGVDSKDGQEGGIFPGANEGIFEYLSTKWELVPVPGGSVQTRVQLEIQFEFRNQFHAAMMSAVEGQMAGVMIEAFEKRIREVEGR